MKNKEKKPLLTRVLASIGSIMLIGSLIYIFIAGFNYYASTVMVVAILGLGTPAVVAGESFVEMIVGFFEMLVEGVVTAVECIFDVIGSIFNF